MQFKVPQNIDMQDKIIGPLTLIQFLYLMGGGMIVYTVLNTVHNGFLVALICIPVGFLALALTFLKVQDQPFAHFLLSFILYLVLPRNRIWQKNLDLETVKVVEKKESEKIEAKPAKINTYEKANIDELSYILDTRGVGEKGGTDNARAKETAKSQAS